MCHLQLADECYVRVHHDHKRRLHVPQHAIIPALKRVEHHTLQHRGILL